MMVQLSELIILKVAKPGGGRSGSRTQATVALPLARPHKVSLTFSPAGSPGLKHNFLNQYTHREEWSWEVI